MAGKISNDDDIIAEINIVPFVDIILVAITIKVSKWCAVDVCQDVGASSRDTFETAI